MKAGNILVVTIGLVLAGGGCALAGADTEPVIVVPGRAGVPIMIEGQDVSGAVIEGEWGLARGHTGIRIIRPWPIYQWQGPQFGAVRPYFPSAGRKPAYGRLEIVPPPDRKMPRPAQSFNREWTSESAPLPATIPTPYAMPPVMIGPRRPPDAGRHGPQPIY